MKTPQHKFKKIVWDYYTTSPRNFVWRNLPTSYNVLVSEFMLQQTQTSRVIPKFAEFMEIFPTLDDLAMGTWEEVLQLWVGLGYNRRARNLWLTAQKIKQEYNSTIPRDKAILMTMPGIGDYTSSAIRAFAFNEADPFIETNIRTVYLHHFFVDQTQVPDSLIIPVILETLDRDNPREWYWALMDYGVHLKTTIGNANLRSKHYTKQSKFEGSSRQLRSQILKTVLLNKQITHTELQSEVGYDARTPKLIEALVKEGLITYNGKQYSM